MGKYLLGPALLFVCFLQHLSSPAQTNLLLNGNFEDINTCTEYNAECGVEAWFYLKEVKAQMLSNETGIPSFGNNTLGLSFAWLGYTEFAPLIGTILPCQLQAGLRYTFRGMYKVILNNQLLFKPGVSIGEKFYVPNRPFATALQPDSILQIEHFTNTNFFRFQYSFIATGKERYLTFGNYVTEDTSINKHKFIGKQTVYVTLDNFELIPEDRNEKLCDNLITYKKRIYNYNFRHKDMDYALYGNGELVIKLNDPDSSAVTQIIPDPPVNRLPEADTLNLGDVLFDFNKASLKSGALTLLNKFFKQDPSAATQIDSIYVEGHTDSVGSNDFNLKLSRNRCESVRYWLQQNILLSKDRIQIHPFGKTRPVATNKTSQGRALNRRVEIIIFRNRKT